MMDMMKSMRILPVRIVAFTLVLLLSACGDDAVLPPLAPGDRILAFGDSLTAGNGAPSDGSYPAQLSRLLEIEVINAGVSGEESREGLARLAALLDQQRPTLLILCHGGNDLLRKRPIAGLENNLREMIALAQARNIPVLMLGVPSPGIFLSSEDVYATVAEDTGVAFIEDLVSDVLSSPAMKSDSVHPNESGYGEMARTIAEALENFGAI